MVYGDIQFFDIIVFAGIAAFLIYRLRNVLGKRDGFVKENKLNNEKPKDKNLEKPSIPQLKENEKELSAVYEALPNFDHKNFLEGAKFAFETIINSFNKGDKKNLKNLLTKEVFLSFEKAMDGNNNNSNFQFYSLVVDSVESVLVEKGIINISLKITSEQFENNDESTIIKKQDLWTFQKNIKSNSSIWLLSST